MSSFSGPDEHAATTPVTLAANNHCTTWPTNDPAPSPALYVPASVPPFPVAPAAAQYEADQSGGMHDKAETRRRIGGQRTYLRDRSWNGHHHLTGQRPESEPRMPRPVAWSEIVQGTAMTDFYWVSPRCMPPPLHPDTIARINAGVSPESHASIWIEIEEAT